MKRTIILHLTAFFFFLTSALFGQWEKQNHIEKGYIQTDKPMYMPGDEMWIKALVVNGANQPTLLSQEAILEMIKPDGSKLFTKNVTIKDSSISEHVNLQPTIAGGVYQLQLKTLK